VRQGGNPRENSTRYVTGTDREIVTNRAGSFHQDVPDREIYRPDWSLTEMSLTPRRLNERCKERAPLSLSLSLSVSRTRLPEKFR